MEFKIVRMDEMLVPGSDSEKEYIKYLVKKYDATYAIENK